MILIDYSGIAIAALFSGGAKGQVIEEGLIRHLILNSLRMYNVKYRNDYGQLIVCCDGPNLWRKKTYTQYKANRKTNRETSSVDWPTFFRVLNQVRDEIRENLPFKVVHVDGAEADDVIATLVESTQEFGAGENVMIVSSDGDFIQLQKYSNVRQYSPILRKTLSERNPIRELQEKVLRGDSGDGVPNVLSSDDVFVRDGGRQKPLSSKTVEIWIKYFDSLQTIMDGTTYAQFCRNRNMIDLSCIPVEISKKIMETYKTTPIAPKMKVLNYLISKKCAMLTACAAEFFPTK